MDTSVTIVDGFRFTGDEINLIDTEWPFSLALDQRAFGPRRLLVVTANRSGQVLGLAHCPQTDPPDLALEFCLDTLDDGAAAAVAYSDERVTQKPPRDLRTRFEAARSVAADYNVHLVDWFMCDDTMMRTMRMSLPDCGTWWDL